MPSRFHLGRTLFLAFYVLWIGTVVPFPALAAERYGKNLIAVIGVPDETVRAFANHTPSKPDPNQSALGNRSANAVELKGHPIPTPASGNSYRMVLKINGEVVENGVSQTFWSMGWMREAPNGGDVTVMAGMPVVEAEGKVGKVMSLLAQTNPISFKDDISTVPRLSYMGAKNFKITSLEVELWSGLPGTSMNEVARSLAWVVFSMLMVLSGWWFFRRK